MRRLSHLFRRCLRQLQFCLNALRLGFVFVRARSFKMAQRIKAAGKSIQLQYPPDKGAANDFFACCIRNDYGLRKRLYDVRTILDIGANAGFFSIAARSRYPDAAIHAYEPNPCVLPFLRSNTELLGISIHPEAVGAENSRVSIIESLASNQARTLSTSDGAIVQVSLETAIERMGGTVDLLKLDCEGAEWDMFRSTPPWAHVRNIRMEYHLFRGETVEDVERALTGLGFKATHWQRDMGFGIVWAVPFSPVS